MEMQLPLQCKKYKKVSITIRYCIKSLFHAMRDSGLGRDLLPLSKKIPRNIS